MTVLQTVKLFRVSMDQEEQAEVIELNAKIATNEIDKLWWKHPNLAEDLPVQSDQHWKWRDIVKGFGHHILQDCIAVRSSQNYIEGAMTYRFDGKSKISLGEGTVYIDRLAAAPRNRLRMVTPLHLPEYRGTGSVLIYKAIRDSYGAGLAGRITLQSLPTKDTIGFYEKKGFLRTDLSQPLTGLIDYELPESAAVAWLRKEGDLP